MQTDITLEEHKHWMGKALALAQQAKALGEVPVGAVICQGNRLISTGFNRRELARDGTAHAEFLAIQRACRTLDGWRLPGCRLYVTLEPCLMCAGAIINTRIPQVIFGAYDPKAGCLGSVTDVRTLGLNHRPEVLGGVRQAEASQLLVSFFRELREK